MKRWMAWTGAAAMAIAITAGLSKAQESGCPTWKQWTQENPEGAKNAHTLLGAWRLVQEWYAGADSSWSRSGARTGLMLFTKGQYARTHMANDRALHSRPFPDWRATTDEERIRDHNTLLSNAGCWAVQDTVLSFWVEVAKWPNLVGRRLDHRFRVDGDTLRIEGSELMAPANRWGEVWVRRQ